MRSRAKCRFGIRQFRTTSGEQRFLDCFWRDAPGSGAGNRRPYLRGDDSTLLLARNRHPATPVTRSGVEFSDLGERCRNTRESPFDEQGQFKDNSGSSSYRIEVSALVSRGGSGGTGRRARLRNKNLHARNKVLA